MQAPVACSPVLRFFRDNRIPGLLLDAGRLKPRVVSRVCRTFDLSQHVGRLLGYCKNFVRLGIGHCMGGGPQFAYPCLRGNDSPRRLRQDHIHQSARDGAHLARHVRVTTHDSAGERSRGEGDGAIGQCGADGFVGARNGWRRGGGGREYLLSCGVCEDSQFLRGRLLTLAGRPWTAGRARLFRRRQAENARAVGLDG